MGGRNENSRLDRERLEQLVSEGFTIREIAEQLGRASATVKKWLTRYGLKAQRASGSGGNPDHEALVSRVCRHHGLTEFVRSGDGYYRCRRCRVESVVRRRRHVKELLAREAGGRCVLCGTAGISAHCSFITSTRLRSAWVCREQG
jgi:transposase